MPKDYLDDFVCDVTCEEFYDEDEDMFWGDQEEQAHAGGMIDAMVESAYSTNNYSEKNYKCNLESDDLIMVLANAAYSHTNIDMRTQWDINADTAENIYGSYVDRHERFFICPECGEPVYESDWSADELNDFLCPICEFYEEEE